MKNYITLAFLCLFIGSSLYGQRKKEDESPVYKEGIVYSLPRSVIRVVVEAEKESYFHGPYYQYADQLLGLTEVPSEDLVKWKLTNFKIETYGEADPNALYQAFGKNAALLSLTPEGILQGINSPVVAQVSQSYPTKNYMEGDSIPAIVFPDLSMHTFLNEEDTTGANGPKSLQDKAIEAAHDITKLRKRRFLTLAANYDELPPDGMAYRVMVDELNVLEKEYVALFTGKTFKQRYRYVYEYTPNEKSAKGEVLFRFSPDKGVLSSSDLSARPIMLEVLKNDALAGAQTSTVAKSTNPYAGASGLFYRIPGNGTIRIVSSGNLLAEQKALIPQFGTIAAIPETFLTGSYAIEIHPSTGTIKSVTQTGTEYKR